MYHKNYLMLYTFIILMNKLEFNTAIIYNNLNKNE